MTRILVAIAMALLAFSSSAWAEERALTLRHTHTGESATIVFKRDGRFDPGGLASLNDFLADWRNGKQTGMDPALFDLIWQIYQDVGATQPINVVSSYRSPETNEMLRSKSSGVAENSQHTHGKALDFFIPGVRLDVLRAAAMRRQGGGVGYYPTSGSPFVHVDTGSVRAWPRMTTAQLKAVFPDGNTSHLPSDGPALSPVAQPAVAVASLAPAPEGNSKPRTLMDLLFGQQQAPTAAAQPPSPTKTDERLPTSPASMAVATPSVQPPMPVPRPPDLYDRRIEVAAAVPPAPRPRPSSEVAIRIVEDDYPMLGYMPKASEAIGLDANGVADDPFAFVSMIAQSVAPTRSIDVPAHMLHQDMASSSGFSELRAPMMSDISFLVAPLEDRPALGFIKAPQRF